MKGLDGNGYKWVDNCKWNELDRKIVKKNSNWTVGLRNWWRYARRDWVKNGIEQEDKL